MLASFHPALQKFFFHFFFSFSFFIVGSLFRNIHPSLQYSSHSRIHTSWYDFFLSHVHPALCLFPMVTVCTIFLFQLFTIIIKHFGTRVSPSCRFTPPPSPTNIRITHVIQCLQAVPWCRSHHSQHSLGQFQHHTHLRRLWTQGFIYISHYNIVQQNSLTAKGLGPSKLSLIRRVS